MAGITAQHAAALRLILERTAGVLSDWAITGSLGMALEGMDLTVHDIDLQSDAQGVLELEQRLQEWVVIPVRWLESERIRSYLGELEIAGVRVELMGGLQKRLPADAWEPPVAVSEHRRWLTWEGFLVPVLDLEYEAQAYLALGRVEKARQIRAYLETLPDKPGV